MRGIVRLVALVALVLGAVGPARASLFRYGNISWVPIGGTEVVFTVQTAWQLEPHICVDPKTGASKTCGGTGDTPVVNDVVKLSRQGTPTASVVFTYSNSETLTTPSFLVTYVDVPNKWFAALMFDPSTVTSPDLEHILAATQIHHTYPATGGPFTATFGSCCRIGNSDADAPNVHVNNPNPKAYKVRAIVDPSKRPLVLAVPPIVTCPLGADCNFDVAAAPTGGSVPLFSLSDPTDAGGNFVQPATADSAADIGASSGAYTWNTTGVSTSAGRNTLYSTQVTEQDETGSSAVDFMLQVVDTTETAVPSFGEHCSRIVPVIAGQKVNVTVATTTEVDSLSVVPLPSGADPPVVTTLNGVTTATLTWTPGEDQLGAVPLLFVATDQLRQGFCAVTVAVVTCTDDASCPGASGCNAPACVAGRCMNQPNDALCDPAAPCTVRTCDASAPDTSPDGCVAHESSEDDCCSNCLDDDADGITDLEDDDCCTSPVAQNPNERPHLNRTLKARRGKVRFNTRMELGLQGIVDVPEPLRFLLRKGPQLLMCTTVPKDQLSGVLGDLGSTVELISPTAVDPVGGQLNSVFMRKLSTNRIRVRASGLAAPDRIRNKGKVGLTLGAGTMCVRAGKFDSPQ